MKKQSKVSSKTTRKVNGITIESGIPIPEAQNRRGKLKEILTSLKVGDSIVTKPYTRTNMMVCIKKHNLNITLTSRKIDDNNVRIWRVK